MFGHRLVAAVGAAAFCAATLAPVDARAQFGGYGGNVLGGVIGGVIAGSIIAGSRPRVVYARPRVVYARPRVIYARPRVAYARPVPHRQAQAAHAAPAPRAATIDTAADPFARSGAAGTIPVSTRP